MNTPPTADDIATFARAAKALLRKISKYATDGGTFETYSKTELSLAASRDRLEDKIRPLGLTEDVSSLALMDQVKQAYRDCGEAARTVRLAANDAELKRLNEEIRNGRAEREAKCPGITAYEAELRRNRY